MRYHPKVTAFDEKLKKVFDEIDDYLENKYKDIYHLHPARPEKGETANPESDGLFNVGSSFTAGYGSELGRGYTVEIRIVTLQKIDPALMYEIEEDTIALLREKLDKAFPERKLSVSRDRNIIKIHGDLKLGSL